MSTQSSSVNTVAVVTTRNDVEDWVDKFFILKPETINQSDITSPSSYLSTKPENPSDLSPIQIFKECMETYFQILHDHYDRHAMGGSIAFLQGRYLTEAIRDAFTKSLESCDMLIGQSKRMPLEQQQNCRECIKTQFEAIGTLFRQRNENRRSQFITRNVKNIMTTLVKSLETHYFFLHGDNEAPIEDGSPASRQIPWQKFYEHQQMSKFVGESMKETVARCEAFIKKLKLTRDECAKRASSDTDLKLFEDARKAVIRHCEELLARNARNQKKTQDFIGALINTGFELLCKTDMMKVMFPSQEEIKDIVIKVKEDIRKRIRDVLHKNSVNTENCSMLEAEYQGKLEEREESIIKTCMELAAIEKERAIKNFFAQVEKKLDIQNSTVWMAKLAEQSRVPDKHVAIVKNHLFRALRQAKEDCMDYVGSSLEDRTQSKENSSNSGNQNFGKTSSSNGSDMRAINAQRLSPEPSCSSPKKHKHTPYCANHTGDHSSGKSSPEKRMKKS